MKRTDIAYWTICISPGQLWWQKYSPTIQLGDLEMG